MRRGLRYAHASRTAVCALPGGRVVKVPVMPGILKHPAEDALDALLTQPAVLRKYTIEALRVATWFVLRDFPQAWLRECLDDARLRPSRRRAIEFLLDGSDSPGP